VKLVVFDMDGVLTEYFSSWVWVHEHFGTDNDESLRLYMEGRIDDEEFMRRDIELWTSRKEGLTRKDLQEILEKVPIRQGARELVNWLHEKGAKTAIVSGGIDILAERIGRELGIDHVFSNIVEAEDNGRITGRGLSVVKLKDKAGTVRRLREELGVEKEGCAAVGDTNIDASMFEECGLGIAFNPKESARRLIDAADVVVNAERLDEIKPYLELLFE
jgi:phosphoserine phosphatase